MYFPLDKWSICLFVRSKYQIFKQKEITFKHKEQRQIQND